MARKKAKERCLGGLHLVLAVAFCVFIVKAGLSYVFAWLGLLSMPVNLLFRVETAYSLASYAVLLAAGYFVANHFEPRIRKLFLASVSLAFVVACLDLLLPALYAFVPLSGGASFNLAVYSQPLFYVSSLVSGVVWASIFTVLGALLNVFVVNKK
jgi:hypothetical protein